MRWQNGTKWIEGKFKAERQNSIEGGFCPGVGSVEEKWKEKQSPQVDAIALLRAVQRALQYWHFLMYLLLTAPQPAAYQHCSLLLTFYISPFLHNVLLLHLLKDLKPLFTRYFRDLGYAMPSGKESLLDHAEESQMKVLNSAEFSYIHPTLSNSIIPNTGLFYSCWNGRKQICYWTTQSMA